MFEQQSSFEREDSSEPHACALTPLFVGDYHTPSASHSGIFGTLLDFFSLSPPKNGENLLIKWCWPLKGCDPKIRSVSVFPSLSLSSGQVLNQLAQYPSLFHQFIDWRKRNPTYFGSRVFNCGSQRLFSILSDVFIAVFTQLFLFSFFFHFLAAANMLSNTVVFGGSQHFFFHSEITLGVSWKADKFGHSEQHVFSAKSNLSQLRVWMLYLLNLDYDVALLHGKKVSCGR